MTPLRIYALAATVLLLTGCATTTPSSPLLHAAEKGDVATLRQLLDHGADINAPSSWERTPLMGAALSDHLACMKLLLDRGADINATSSYGYTALIWAVQYGSAECVKLLLDRGAKIDQRSRQTGGLEARTTLEWAQKSGRPEIVALIESAEQSAERERTRQLEEPLIAALPHASLPELLVAADSSVNLAGERNHAIIAARTRDLPGLLHDGKSADLTALCVRIEQTILDLNHASEVAKDKAQQAAATNGDARQIDELRGLSISYRERIELLKPILTAIKDEIANRNR